MARPLKGGEAAIADWSLVTQSGGKRQLVGLTQTHLLPISCECWSCCEYFAAGAWYVSVANRFPLSFRSFNKGAPPWRRRQRKRKQRKRSNFELRRCNFKCNVRDWRLDSIQPPFACAICILNGEAGRFKACSTKRLIPSPEIRNAALSNVLLRSLNPSNKFVELNTQIIRLTS